MVTLNRPEAENTIDAQMAQELVDLCWQINQGGEGIRVVVITGAGERFFSTGKDLRLLSTDTAELQQVGQWHPASAIAALGQPVIAALNGDALEQGLELALACDLRIASEGAHFGFPNIAFGLIPLDGGTQRLPRIVGRSKALELILTTEIIDAQEARRIGLVSEVTPPGELVPRVMELGRKLASFAPLALKYTKEAVNQGLDLTLEQALRMENDLYVLLQTTADRTEGIRAFLEKRPPQFKGI